MKEKTRMRKYPDQNEIGDAYTFIGIERETKLLLAWHLGRRSAEDARECADKLAEATTGPHQATTPTAGSKTTPGMAAGLEDHQSTPAELVAKTTQSQATTRHSSCGAESPHADIQENSAPSPNPRVPVTLIPMKLIARFIPL